MTSIKEIIESREAARFEQKLAAVESAFDGDEKAAALFEQAVGELQAAGITEPNDLLDKAAALTIEILEEESAADGGTKVAEEVDYEMLGRAAADVAHAAGITSQEMKTASDEEADATGRLLAHCVRSEILALSDQG